MFGRGLPPIGIGIDICRIPRIYTLLASPSKGNQFVRRILSLEEQTMPYTLNILKCVFVPSENQQSPDLRVPSMQRAAEFMAGRFAAKEAVVKAYSFRKLTFHDIVVTYEGHLSTPSENETLNSSRTEQESTSQDPPNEKPRQGPPVAIIKGDGVHENVYARLSISHDGEYATAMCLTMLEDSGASRVSSAPSDEGQNRSPHDDPVRPIGPFGQIPKTPFDSF
ncbi:hypothetical protein F4821DRAFT_130939 [Hypoxylon rubiginosum]|uniref:Uncharacterized protein n=1 Tax=Hypoxylon rubiginosum TaxID=110542 RepID=A0ACC0D145_9PEZI|nr:hypothetical protein F4821DRAFT_130939 [Hypoxylon rubiginosum]